MIIEKKSLLEHSLEHSSSTNESSKFSDELNQIDNISNNNNNNNDEDEDNKKKKEDNIINNNSNNKNNKDTDMLVIIDPSNNNNNNDNKIDCDDDDEANESKKEKTPLSLSSSSVVVVESRLIHNDNDLDKIDSNNNNNNNKDNQLKLNSHSSTSSSITNELLNIWMKRTITSSSKLLSSSSSSVDVQQQQQQEKHFKSQSTNGNNEFLLFHNNNNNSKKADDNSVSHSTHHNNNNKIIKNNRNKTKKSKTLSTTTFTKTSTSTKFHILTTIGDHPYSKKTRCQRKRQPKQQKQQLPIKRRSRKTTKKSKSIFLQKSGSNEQQQLKIVPIKVEFNETSCGESSKILLLNDIYSNALNVTNSLNFLGSNFEPNKQISTMVRDTSVRYLSDTKPHKIALHQPIFHHPHHQKPTMVPTNNLNLNNNNYEMMAFNMNNVIDPTTGTTTMIAATSLPPIQTILNDPINSNQSGLLRSFEECDIRTGKVQVNNNYIDYFINSNDEEDNLSNVKCLPFGYFINDDDNDDISQLISSPTPPSLPSSNNSSPIFDDINIFAINNNDNFTSDSRKFFNENIEYQTLNELVFENKQQNSELTLTQLNSTNPNIKEEIESNEIWSNQHSNNFNQNENLIELNNNGSTIVAKKSTNFNKNYYNNRNLDENVMDDTSLEIENFFQSQPQQQQNQHPIIITNNSQMYSQNDTSNYFINNNNGSFIIQDSIPQLYSSPNIQQQQQQSGQGSNLIGNDLQISLNQLLMNNVNSAEYILDNSILVSNNNSLSSNIAIKSTLNLPELTALISNPNLNNINNNINSSDNLKFNLPSNSSTILSSNYLNTNINSNRIRNNSMSTDISSHDEGFASQPEDDFDESDNNSESINNINNNADFIENGQIFSVPKIDDYDNNNIVLKTNDDDESNNNDSKSIILPENSLIIKEEFMDNFWSNNSNTSQTTNILQSSQINNNKAKQQLSFGQASSSNLSAIDENEESDDDDDDESFYDEYDASDLIGATVSDDINNKWCLVMGRSRKSNDKRHFWQYNVQSKGPKGPRIGSGSFDEDDDPHVFNEISDPVFSPDCPVEGVKHSGKARRGDGNDLTANPKKLLMIGLELKKLAKIINELTPVTELPFVCRNKSRKEKNKLASRACRLKKKAQHEANKIKLHGLHREHGRLIKLINGYRQLIEKSIQLKETKQPVYIKLDDCSSMIQSIPELYPIFDKLVHKTSYEIAGKTADFVNTILDNVTTGIIDGGLNNY